MTKIFIFITQEIENFCHQRFYPDKTKKNKRMKLIFITVAIMLSVVAKGQSIDYDMLEKYSHSEAQEAVINKQVALLN